MAADALPCAHKAAITPGFGHMAARTHARTQLNERTAATSYQQLWLGIAASKCPLATVSSLSERTLDTMSSERALALQVAAPEMRTGVCVHCYMPHPFVAEGGQSAAAALALNIALSKRTPVAGYRTGSSCAPCQPPNRTTARIRRLCCLPPRAAPSAAPAGAGPSAATS